MARYVNRSRAAVICFGGWGLQTMLHLWPRVRFVQEERRILGIEQELPDLNKQTAFACVMPHPIVKHEDGSVGPPITVVRPTPVPYPRPYYVEEKLLRHPIDKGDATLGLTRSEVWARLLYKHALEERRIEELTISEPFGYELPDSNGRLWHQDMFSAGIAWAETTAKALLRYAIEPTRLDRIQTLDPHVQTNIYVVAPLAELLTSALIWPIVSELVATLGTRNIARVIAFFSTGSFALDDTAAVEEAACYSALRELESLTGVNKVGLKELRNRVLVSGKRGWPERVGIPLFDRVYLLDKEKANAGLAQDAQELAVLTGNAIESFLIADGATHLETRLGPDIDAKSSQKRYSLIGSANDYVPLADYIDAAIHDEQKRIARALVVPPDSEMTVNANLGDLSARPDVAVKDLMRSGAMRMFENEMGVRTTSRRWRRRLENAWNRIHRREENASPMPDWLPELRIARSYLLPDSVLERLGRQRLAWQWRMEFNDHINALAKNIEPELKTQRFARVWGIPDHYPTSTQGFPRVLDRLDNRNTTVGELPSETLDELRESQSRLVDEINRYSEKPDKPWATRWRNDQRVIPHAMYEALHAVVDDVRAAPSGLLKANMRLKTWLEESEAVVEELGENAVDPEDREWSQSYAGELNEFERRFASEAGNYPQQAAIWARAMLTGFFITFFVFNWLLFELRLDLTQWQVLLIGMGCVGTTAVLAGIAQGLARWRIRRLKNRRATLAQERLSRNANQYVRTNLHSVYRRLGDVLGDMQTEIDSTIESLRKWSGSEEKIHVLPLGIERSHLRTAHMSDMIWERVKEHVQGERSPAENLTAEVLFIRAWTKDGSTDRLWYEAGQKSEDRLAQRIRLALELPFNRLEMNEHIVEIETFRRLIQSRLDEGASASTDHRTPLDDLIEATQEKITEDLESHTWCGFRDKDGRCSACPGLDDCPSFADERVPASEQTTVPSWSLHGLIETYLERSTEHLHPSGAIFTGSKEAIQNIIDEFKIEKLILGTEGSLTEAGAQEHRRDFVEESVARAKPSANSELADPFEDSLVDIEFSVTPEGARSPLEPIYRERKISLLPSRDPTSITTVRTLNWLALQDLLFMGRCRTEMIRLDDGDRKKLTLMKQLPENVAQELYDLPKGSEQAKYVRYQPILE